MNLFLEPAYLYGLLQVSVLGTFAITALRARNHSRERLVELLAALMFGLLLEQGDIFLFGTYRYNPNWLLLGDVPPAIALTWALIIAGAMNITDALGIPDAGSVMISGNVPGQSPSLRRRLDPVVRGLAAPAADALWAILLDLALDAVAIRLGLWTWTIDADQGWFGVPWGNFFAWLFVAFWFSFFTRLVRARSREHPRVVRLQWLVPFVAFGGLIATLVPFVAIENTAALPFVTVEAQSYRNQVWIVFAFFLFLFAAVTTRSLLGKRTRRETPDHWLLLVRFVIHALFLSALIASGIYVQLPILLVVALFLLAVELMLTRTWILQLFRGTRALRKIG